LRVAQVAFGVEGDGEESVEGVSRRCEAVAEDIDSYGLRELRDAVFLEQAYLA
jgi:hypothetical protein